MSALTGMIWPQRSLISHRELAGPGALEPELWSKLSFLSAPLCARCGMQFEIAVEPRQVCGAIIADPPAYDRARAAVIDGDVSRDLVLGLNTRGGGMGWPCRAAGWPGRVRRCWPRRT